MLSPWPAQGGQAGAALRLRRPRCPPPRQSPVSHYAASDLRTCNACSTRVHRDEVHKNRYGQYICKACRSDGVRAVGRRRISHLMHRMPTALLAFLIVVLATAAILVALMTVGKLHTYSNGGMVEDLKALVRSINKLAR